MRYRRLSCIFILSALLILSACSSFSTDCYENNSSGALDRFIDVLKNNAVFYSHTHAGIDQTTMSELLKGYSWDDEYTVYIQEFSIVDMDGDGVPEVVLQLSAGGERIVLHYENGTIHAHGFPFRGLNALKYDGTFISSGGAAYNSIGRLYFLDGGISRTRWLASSNSFEYNGERHPIYFVDDEEASSEMFSHLMSEHLAKEHVKWYPFDNIINP